MALMIHIHPVRPNGVAERRAMRRGACSPLRKRRDARLVRSSPLLCPPPIYSARLRPSRTKSTISSRLNPRFTPPTSKGEPDAA